MSPKVSAVVPTYNRADLLPETLKSILAQRMSDFELLIIDDGSTDATREVVAPFLSDPRVKYIYQSNGGEPSAVNHGWRLSTGEYFTQVNSDDPVLPDLLTEMCAAMDAHPNAVVGYCDFQFIDESGKAIKVITNPSWDFTQQLKNFSCVAASPGTFFRKSLLSHWATIRQHPFRYINDIAMYWDIALEGEFIHVPKVLANWRQHPDQISNNRYMAIPEVEQWIENYFSKPNLPDEVMMCKKACFNSIKNYAFKLIQDSDLNESVKYSKLFQIKKDKLLYDYSYINLQVGDQDLVGNKFNGHDLHLLLQDKGIQSIHCVTNKLSEDKHTLKVTKEKGETLSQWLIHSEIFSYSDIMHLHLIHNTDFDIKDLPVITRLKPTVMTLHDPFFLGGHCIHHHDCEKWKDQCFECPYLDVPFVVKEDISAIQHFEKKVAFQNANLSVIVASKWMERKVKLSPVFKNKKIYYIPFGINQDIFKPVNPDEAKAKLGIPKENFVIMFRSDVNPFKGLDVIKATIEKINFSRPVTLVLVGQKYQMKEFESQFQILDFGWLTDDHKLASLYQACDIFLMPSRQETFGMMAIEAMSCGKTVLAINGTALPDVINSPECGIAVNELDYANTLQRLIDSPEQLKQHGEASCQYALENYNLEKYIGTMIAAYKDIMRDFVPDPSSQLVLQQLARNAIIKSNLSTDLDTFYTSVSWRITKSVRALRGARMMSPEGLKSQIDFFIRYMKDKKDDRVDDEVIQNSVYWKITRPLRSFKILNKFIKRNVWFINKVKSFVKSRLKLK